MGMLMAIILGGCVASAVFAIVKGQNPLLWALSSIPGVALLTLLPGAKGRGLAERRRARREVGDKLGLMTSGAMVIVVIVLSIVGVL